MLKLITQHFNRYKSTINNYFKQQYQKGNYYGVLKVDNPTAITNQQLKQAYYNLLKKYHTDKIASETQSIKQQYQEITKYINKAYESIQRERISQTTNHQKGTILQDEISMKIFGKKFDDVKYDLYRQENWAKRHLFNEQILRNKQYQKEKNKYAQPNNQQTYKQEKAYQGTIDNDKKYNRYWIYFVFGGGLVVISILVKMSNKATVIDYHERPKTYTPQKFKEIQKKSQTLFKQKIDNVINSIIDQHPLMLKYPSDTDPDVNIQLTQYSIAPHIHLYEVSPKYFSQKQNIEIPFDQLQKYQLKKIKQNTLLTLSLQAQRSLQNVYVKVKDVINEIQQTGKYTPPKVFFRFFGYIMFEIRQKPLSLKNYRNTQWISLFDLYFHYYSPIFFKRNQYGQYLVGLDNTNKFGYVHLNHRQIPQIMLSPKKNYVILRPVKSIQQGKYQSIWNGLANPQKKGDRSAPNCIN